MRSLLSDGHFLRVAGASKMQNFNGRDGRRICKAAVGIVGVRFAKGGATAARG
jgi:hypothetical protein